MSTPKPGSAEWQKQLDDAVADHDAQQQASGNENDAMDSESYDALLQLATRTVAVS